MSQENDPEEKEYHDSEEHKGTDEFSRESNPLVVARQISSDLEKFKENRNKGELMESLRQRFIAARVESGTIAEAARARALQQLIRKMENMGTSQLLRTIEILSSISESDALALQGINPAGGMSFHFNHNNSTVTNTQNNTVNMGEGDGGSSSERVKSGSRLLEALSLASDAISGRQIEHKPGEPVPQQDIQEGEYVEVPNDKQGD